MIQKHIFVFVTDADDLRFIMENSGPVLTWSNRVALDARFLKGRHDVFMYVYIGWINPREGRVSLSMECCPEDIPLLEKSLKMLSHQMPAPIWRLLKGALQIWKLEPNFVNLEP
jgi:hypothetical protein